MSAPDGGTMGIDMGVCANANDAELIYKDDD